MDVRKAAAEQIGHLTLMVYELTAQLDDANGQIETLKKTQSEGKAKAETLLKEQESK